MPEIQTNPVDVATLVFVRIGSGHVAAVASQLAQKLSWPLRG